MGRILDKTLYPLDTNVTKDDYLVGTDVDNNFKTVNFNIGSIIRLINSEINFSSAEFRYADGTDAEISESTVGIFVTETGNDDPELTQVIKINKKNLGGQDLSDLFALLQNNVYSFSLKLINSSDPADTFYFRVNTVTSNPEYFELDVAIIGEGYNRSFTDLTTYNLFFEVIGSQNNKNVVQSASVSGDITNDKAATAINALPSFTVTDEQTVFFQITSDNGKSITFISVDKGKGTYGTGGTQLVASDLESIAVSDGGPLNTVIKKFTFEDLLTSINSLAVYGITHNTALYFYATPTDSPDETYIYVAKNLAAGSYGVGETAIVDTDLELISVLGGNVNVVKAVTITGDPTEANVTTAINGLAQFEVTGNQNVYYKVSVTGSQMVYTFIPKGKGAGTYGVGGTALTASDVELISVIGGGTTWKLKTGGVERKTINAGDSVDFKGKKYAVVTYVDGGIVEISTSQTLDDLLATFKPIKKVTKAQHQALIDAGTIDNNTVYLIPCV